MGQLKDLITRRRRSLTNTFPTVGEKLANDLLVCSQASSNIHFYRVSPCIMNISISRTNVAESIKRMKANKACGPDNVSPRLLKNAGKELIATLLSLYTKSAVRNSVPASWKTVNVSALFKKDDERDKQNYRPISLLCVPGKRIEQAVATTITTHISEQSWPF